MRRVVVALLLIAGLATHSPGASRAAGVPLLDIQPVAMCLAGTCPEAKIDVSYLDTIARHAGLRLRVRPALTQKFPFPRSTPAIEVLERFTDYGRPLADASGVRNRIYAGYVDWEDLAYGLAYRDGLQGDPSSLGQLPFLVLTPRLNDTGTTSVLASEIGILLGAGRVSERGVLDSNFFDASAAERGEITRFSAQGQNAIDTNAGLSFIPQASQAGATVVPLPPAGFALFTGLLCLAALRRRRMAAL